MNDINEIEFERGIRDCRMGEPAKLNASESYVLGYNEERPYTDKRNERPGL